MNQSPPRFLDAVGDHVDLAAALGLDPGDLTISEPPQVVSTGAAHLMVPVRDRAGVDRAIPDGPRLRAVLAAVGGEGCYLYSRDPVDAADAVAYARFFNPTMGIIEDPATRNRGRTADRPARRLGHCLRPRHRRRRARPHARTAEQDPGHRVRTAGSRERVGTGRGKRHPQHLGQRPHTRAQPRRGPKTSSPHAAGISAFPNPPWPGDAYARSEWCLWMRSRVVQPRQRAVGATIRGDSEVAIALARANQTVGPSSRSTTRRAKQSVGTPITRCPRRPSVR